MNLSANECDECRASALLLTQHCDCKPGNCCTMKRVMGVHFPCTDLISPLPETSGGLVMLPQLACASRWWLNSHGAVTVFSPSPAVASRDEKTAELLKSAALVIVCFNYLVLF